MRAFVLALFLAACSSSTETQRLCADADFGTLAISYTEREGGSCGPLPDVAAVDTALALPSADAMAVCASKAIYREATCEEKEEETCANADASTAQAAATIGVDASGKPTNGFVQVNAYDPTGGLTCTSTYDLTFTR